MRQAVELQPVAPSLYVIPCPCGKDVTSHTPVCVCPHCGLLLEVQAWGR